MTNGGDYHDPGKDIWVILRCAWDDGLAVRLVDGGVLDLCSKDSFPHTSEAYRMICLTVSV